MLDKRLVLRVLWLLARVAFRVASDIHYMAPVELRSSCSQTQDIAQEAMRTVGRLLEQSHYTESDVNHD